MIPENESGARLPLPQLALTLIQFLLPFQSNWLLRTENTLFCMFVDSAQSNMCSVLDSFEIIIFALNIFCSSVDSCEEKHCINTVYVNYSKRQCINLAECELCSGDFSQTAPHNLGYHNIVELHTYLRFIRMRANDTSNELEQGADARHPSEQHQCKPQPPILVQHFN